MSNSLGSRKPHHRNRKHILPVERIRALYLSGASTRAIAEMCRCSKSQVHVLCKDIAREKLDALRLAVALRRPKETTHWRTCRWRARRIMEKYLGRKLTSNEHVHHKNKDFTDNRLENLEVLLASDHTCLHHPKNPIPRHLRPERQRYMREYLKNYKKS